MNMTSNCDITNSAHQIQMTTICHWMQPPHENFLRTPLVLNIKINFRFSVFELFGTSLVAGFSYFLRISKLVRKTFLLLCVVRSWLEIAQRSWNACLQYAIKKLTKILKKCRVKFAVCAAISTTTQTTISRCAAEMWWPEAWTSVTTGAWRNPVQEARWTRLQTCAKSTRAGKLELSGSVQLLKARSSRNAWRRFGAFVLKVAVKPPTVNGDDCRFFDQKPTY